MSKNQIRIIVIACICAVIAAVVIVAVVMESGPSEVVDAGDGGNGGASFGAAEDLPKLAVNSVTESGDDMVVDTSYFNFSYPAMYIDVMTVEAVSDGDHRALDFIAILDGKKEKAYSILFGSKDGIDFGTLTLDGVADPIRVSVVFYELSPGYDEVQTVTFNAVAETINDVNASLDKVEGFKS